MTTAHAQEARTVPPRFAARTSPARTARSRSTGVRDGALALATLLFVAACSPAPAAPPAAPAPMPPASAEPRADDPPPVIDGDITIAYANGLRIVVKRVAGAELAAIDLFIAGGARTWTQRNAGVELLALRTAVEGGTRTLDKDAFSRKLSALGSTLGTASRPDYSVIAAKCLTEQIDATFALLVDAFRSPAMPPAEIEVGRQRQLAEIRGNEETADGRLGLLATQTVYRDHPYENLPTGNVESVSRLLADDLNERLASLRQTRRLVLVVVGDVTVDRVQRLARESLAQLPPGAAVTGALPSPAFDAPRLVVHREALPTNYVQASFVGPDWAQPEFAAGIVAMRILDSRVWEEVRTKRSLSYAPSAFYRWTNRVTRGGLYVTAVDPNAAMKVMLDEARRLQTTAVSEAELAGVKGQLRTSHLMDNESTDGQASWLATSDLAGGDYRLARQVPERIKQVTAADVQAFATRYLRNLQTVVLGDPDQLDRALFESL